MTNLSCVLFLSPIVVLYGSPIVFTVAPLDALPLWKIALRIGSRQVSMNLLRIGVPVASQQSRRAPSSNFVADQLCTRCRSGWLGLDASHWSLLHRLGRSCAERSLCKANHDIDQLEPAALRSRAADVEPQQPPPLSRDCHPRTVNPGSWIDSAGDELALFQPAAEVGDDPVPGSGGLICQHPFGADLEAVAAKQADKGHMLEPSGCRERPLPSGEQLRVTPGLDRLLERQPAFVGRHRCSAAPSSSIVHTDRNRKPSSRSTA